MHKAYTHILMVYPEFPVTYWGLQHSLPLIGKKAPMPPLGLITIAAMTPPEYECRVVDLNCEPLREDDLAWADMVCFSAMLPQRRSLFATATRCRNAGKLVVFGGPFPTACPGECALYCDVQVLNEGEVTWPMFLDDIARGLYRPVYASDEKPDLSRTPVPRFDLLKIQDYGSIPIQFSRGCPFLCEFCDIIVMFGRRPRTKTPEQFCSELEALYQTGFRGAVFVVDDNFIGNKRDVKRLLPHLKAWNEAHGMPFVYGTEATINLADDAALMRQMVEAAFSMVFIGIETPSVESLKETQKFQNIRRSLIDSIHAIQTAGLFVNAGFIIGFDSDTEDIFDRQIEFITQAGIPGAMVGLLMALPGTPLYKRLQEAGRLDLEGFEEYSDQCGNTNIVTTLPRRTLLEGYRRVIATIYSPRAYFARARDACRRLPRPATWRGRLDLFLSLQKLSGIRKSGIRTRAAYLYRFLKKLPKRYRWETLRFLLSIVKECPERFPETLRYVYLGLHFCQFSADSVLPQLDSRIANYGNASEVTRSAG